jgi:hypothetical protein
MNKHILLVMKWLKNPESVTQEELDANRESAYDANREFAYDTYRYARSAYWAADYAAYYAADYDGSRATYWVNEYFKITGENKQTYIDMLGE